MKYVSDTFWIYLKDILKTCEQEQLNLMILLSNVLKASSKRLENVLKMCWRRFEDVLKIFWRRLENVLKTSSKDVWARRLYSSWWRRLVDVLKMYSEDENKKRLQDVFKTSSSRWMFAGFLKFLELLSLRTASSACWYKLYILSWDKSGYH